MLQVKVNADEVVQQLGNVQERQLPYAIALALNRVSVLGQKAEQERIKARFTLNPGRAGWVLKGVYRSKENKATKTKWYVILELQGERDFLEKFETSGEHVPMGSRQYLWIPNRKVFKHGIVSKGDALRPSKIKFKRDAHHGGYHGMHADNGIYMIERMDGDLLVMQNTGMGKHFTQKSMASLTLNNVATGIGPHRKRHSAKLQRKAGTRKLYTLKERVTVPVKLGFIDGISEAVLKHFDRVFTDAIDHATTTARR